ncbi:lipase family protein [Nocardia vinacea]|uniref:esterase/lipase family protein n=1 Tax=Nocardia vinacea TaxID=96468 RepID=UPI002E14D302|nr:lipase family protein [Nocardia vinacea]
MRLRRITLSLVGFALCAAPMPLAAAEPETYPTATWEQVQDEETRWAQEGKVEAPTPPGVNRYDCVPTVPGAVPVVLLHGFAGDEYRAWGYLGPALTNAGLCVYSFSYGGSNAMQGGGNGPLADSAVEIKQKLTALTTRLGVPKVDLIGHSEGGIMAQYIVKTDPAIATGVHSVTTISSPTHGTLGNLGATLLNAGNFRDELPVPPAVKDLLAGSAFLQELNSGPITVPGVAYTTISSRFDPISSFGQNQAMIAEPGVDNYVLQNVCPGSKAGHNGTVFSPTTAALVLNRLDHSAVRPIPCQDDSTG